MHEYSIIIFITGNSLQAFDAQDGTAVSIKGNVSMPCISIEDVQAFNGFIQRQYNFDNYTDFDTGITIINCGAEPSMVHCLFGLVKEAAQVNLIEAACVLPLIAVTGGAVKKGGCKKYSLFGTFYEVITDENMAITCRPCADGTDAEQLSPEHFKLLFTVDGKKIGADENELKALIAEKDALIRKNAELEAHIKAMEADRAELARLKKAQADAAAAQKRKEEEEKAAALYKELEELQQSIHQCVIKKTWKNSRFALSDCGRHEVKNGQLIDKDGIVGFVYALDSSRPAFWANLTEPIFSKKIGRLFLLKNDAQDVSNGDAVALVVDPDWSRKQALTWYEKYKDKLPLLDELKKKRERSKK